MTALVDLRGDYTVQGNVWIFLGVIAGFDAVDPNLDAWTFSEDAVFIPAEGIDRLEQLFLVNRGGVDEAASMFVEDLAKPPLAAVDLVPGHGYTIRQARASDLDATVYLSGRQSLEHLIFMFSSKFLVFFVLMVVGKLE